MLIVSICLIIVSICLTIYSFNEIKHSKEKAECCISEYHKKLQNENEKLGFECNETRKKINLLNNECEVIKTRYNTKKMELDIAETHYNDLKSKMHDAQNMLENQKELSQKAFENYCEVLEKDLTEKEEEYDMYKDAMETAYSNLQLKLIQERDEIQEELDKIKATRAAALQAKLREQEIEENLSFYCLKISDNELKDISVLESIKSKLNNPRILSMLIWKTYWQKPMDRICADIIGTTIKTGIYKITNIKTKECYIGQAVDLATRFKQHCKCGLGIDTPAGNKLYKAMQEYGVWNFSWEILEEVPSTQLNEKEKYYIELYDAKNFGYNSNNGVNK